MKRSEEPLVDNSGGEAETNGRPAKKSKSASSSLLYKHENGFFELHQSSLECLNSGIYFNDSIIEFYFAYLLNEVCQKSLISRVRIFDTIFFNKIDQAFNIPGKETLQQPSQQESSEQKTTVPRLEKPPINDKRIHSDRCDELKKWFKNDDIFEKDFLVIPVCADDHWRAILVCYPADVKPLFDGDITNNINKSILLNGTNSIKTGTDRTPAIIVLDSLGLKNRKVTWKVRDFLDYEWRRRNCTEYHSIKRFSYTDLKDYCPRIPKQKNAYDCGLFMLMYIRTFLETPETFYKLAKSDDTDSIKSLRTMIRKSLNDNDRNSIKDLISRVCIENRV